MNSKIQNNDICSVVLSNRKKGPIWRQEQDVEFGCISSCPMPFLLIFDYMLS